MHPPLQSREPHLSKALELARHNGVLTLSYHHTITDAHGHKLRIFDNPAITLRITSPSTGLASGNGTRHLNCAPKPPHPTMLRTTLAREEVAVRNAVDKLLSRQLQQQEDGQFMSYDKEQTLQALLRTPRRRFLFLEAGGVKALVELLKTHGFDRPIPVSELLSIMRLLILCCQDTESAVGVGLFGLHPWIKRVLASDNEEEGQEDDEATEVLREYAEEIASRCARVRGGFPLQRLALCSDSAFSSLHLPVRVPIYSHFRTTTITHAQNHQPGKENESKDLIVLISPIAYRMSSQADTGYFLWPAATILTRFILINSSFFAGKRVMEIGAGLGLCGLVAGRVAKEVLLTDHNLACVRQMQEHVRLNRDDGIGGWEEDRVTSNEGEAAAEAGSAGATLGATVALVHPSTMKVRWLDWDRLEAVSKFTWQVSEKAEEKGIRGGREEEEGAKSEVDEEYDRKENADYHCVSEEEIESFGRPRWSSGLLDVVIGSDCICDEPSAVGVARLLSLTLKPGTGVGYITAPAPQHR